MIIGTQFDVETLRCISSDPHEHTFGMLRQKMSEFTVSHMMDLIDSIIRKTTLFPSTKLSGEMTRQKGVKLLLNKSWSKTVAMLIRQHPARSITHLKS